MNFYYWLGYHLSRLIARVFFHFRVIHRERMIQSGPVILAMNHQSYLDPPLAGVTCNRAIYFWRAKRSWTCRCWAGSAQIECDSS
jgi:1-acyl-sn-glycerol-3-phosphate acyltransferase